MHKFFFRYFLDWKSFLQTIRIRNCDSELELYQIRDCVVALQSKILVEFLFINIFITTFQKWFLKEPCTSVFSKKIDSLVLNVKFRFVFQSMSEDSIRGYLNLIWRWQVSSAEKKWKWKQTLNSSEMDQAETSKLRECFDYSSGKFKKVRGKEALEFWI